MSKYIILIAILLIIGCSLKSKTNCDYENVNLYLYSFELLVPFPMKIDGVISNSSTKKIVIENKDPLNSICKKIANLKPLKKEAIKTFDSRLVVELIKSTSEIDYIAIHSSKKLIFYSNSFYKCDNNCQEEIIEPLLNYFTDK